MEEPRIQYVKTSDGVSIAYYMIGSGAAVPVVWIDLPSHLHAERTMFPDQMRVYKAMSRVGTLVRYDHRGFGLSDPSITKFPLDDLVKDLEAVVDKLALKTFVLLAASIFAGSIAIAYAASHPDRVSKLILGGLATSIPPALHQQIVALMLPGSDWQFVSEAVARLALGWYDEDATRPLAAWFRGSSTYETFKDFWRDIAEWDVRDLLPMVEAPTLIGLSPENKFAGPEQLREMASLIPNAHLVIADGATFEERTTKYEAAAASFIYGPAIAQRANAPRTGAQGTAIILFADIVDSTALTEQLGDAAFREKARQLDDAMRKAIREANGSAVEGKLVGDGVLAVFTAARDAITAAIRCRDESANVGLELHLGIHAGDVIREEGNVYGGAVNIAARISGLSASGEILISDTVRSLARTSAGVSFEDRGEHTLKGIAESQRVFAVVVPGA